MAFQVVPLLLGHVEAGRLRPLAVTDEARSVHLPEVPTTAESGYPKLQATTWLGVLAPAGVPRSIVAKLNIAINDILKSKEMEATLTLLDARPKIGSPQEFATFIAAERTKWTEVINKAGIRIE
jgi:tripartite-type tricarboxylate transporter receptor subunit TctC